MGWTSIVGTPKTQIEMLRRQYTSANTDSSWIYEFMDIKATHYGRRIWVALKNKHSGKSSILLYILEKRETEWWYKDIDESMGILQLDCPMELINKTTGDGTPYSTEWREKIKKNNALKRLNKNVEVGEIITVYGNEYRLTKKIKRSWKGVRLTTGVEYNIRPSQIKKRILTDLNIGE